MTDPLASLLTQCNRFASALDRAGRAAAKLRREFKARVPAALAGTLTPTMTEMATAAESFAGTIEGQVTTLLEALSKAT